MYMPSGAMKSSFILPYLMGLLNVTCTQQHALSTCSLVASLHLACMLLCMTVAPQHHACKL